MTAEALQNALKSLPHGPEFRFVDQLTDLDPGKSGKGHLLVRGDEPFLKGHFPGEPLFPGVLLIEAVAQLSGVIAQTDPVIPPLNSLKLTAVRAAKILGTARPGETVHMEAKILARLENLIQARAQASIGGKTVLQAELTLSGTPAKA